MQSEVGGRCDRLLWSLVADFAALQRNKAAWADELDERESWNGALADGLED